MQSSISNTSPFKMLTIYSLAMITMPIVMYFASKWILEMFLSDQNASIYAIIGSVVTIHIILFGFVYQAYKEDKQIDGRREKAPEKKE